MGLQKARTAASRLLALVSPGPGAPQGGERHRADVREAEHEITRSLDAVLGNVALVLTQLDPNSDAHARAWRALDEAKRIREVVCGVGWAKNSERLRDVRSPGGAVSDRGRRFRRAAGQT
jgi:hypothetical protein